VKRLTAILQGASYLYFGAWSLGRREHYRRVHELSSDDWILNAHGGWLLVVGATLMRAAIRDDTGTLLPLGAGAAAALALNDVLLMRRIAPIYRADVGWELALLAGWTVPGRARGHGDSSA